MRYSILASIYEELEKTSAKLEKTAIISKFLKRAPAKLMPKLVLILMGRVFPAWGAEELGVAHLLMLRAIARATGAPPSKVRKKYTKIGDLGLTVEELVKEKKQITLAKEELSVEKVFLNLQKIAQQVGPGSQDRKLDLIAELLAQAKLKEARYIVRTVLEELRIGVAEGIIRDAIADAFKVNKDVVEGAWFLLPDYGEIAQVAKEKGEKGLKKVKLRLGIPIMVALAEKSPDLKTAVESFDHSILEYKYDGMRTLIQKRGDKIWLFTRRLEDITEAFPDIVELARKCIKAKECILDSETLGIHAKTGGPIPFQLLSTRIKRKYRIEQAIREIPVQVNLFDIVYLEGKQLFNLPLKERRKLLAKSVREIKDKFQLAHSLITKDLRKAEEFYHAALEAGQEGLIVKNLDAVYQPGRRVALGWLKVKPIMETLDLAIVGATWGTGKRAGWLGSFILGCRDPETGKFLECGMLGTGIKEKRTLPTDVTFLELTKMLKPDIIWEKAGVVKLKPKIVIEVAYEEIQKSPTYESGFALRFPRFLRLRPEKGSLEADTLARIEHLYKIEKGKK